MTLDQLKILVKIAESGSVLAAADALHRTQPTISVSIRKFEEELGVELLDRGQYRASLTPAGAQLCQKARSILNQVDEFTVLSRHLALGNEPELFLAIEASCPFPLIRRILGESEKKYPHTEFNLQVESIWGALEKLQNKEVDLAISPWFEDLPGIESMALTQIRLITVAAPGFCRQTEDLSLEEMKGHVQVVVRDSSRKPQLRSYGVVDGGRRWMVSDHVTKKELILAGMGWGKLQEHLIAEELAEGGLVPLQINHHVCLVEMEVRAARRLGEPVGPVALALWEDFRNLSGKEQNRS